MNQTGPNGQGSNAIKYSSTGGMNKALRLALDFYKIHKRLPNAHECHHISQRALELLAISDPGARHYVTGPQICSQFNNVARDLSSLDKRLEKRKIVSESDNPAYSEAQRRTQQWEEDRYRVLQQVAIASPCVQCVAYIDALRPTGHILADIAHTELQSYIMWRAIRIRYLCHQS